MNLAALLEPFRGSPGFDKAADALLAGEAVTAVEPVRPALVGALADREPGPWLVVAAGLA